MAVTDGHIGNSVSDWPCWFLFHFQSVFCQPVVASLNVYVCRRLCQSRKRLCWRVRLSRSLFLFEARAAGEAQELDCVLTDRPCDRVYRVRPAVMR